MSLKNLPQPSPKRPLDQLKEAIIEGIREKKGVDVISLDLSGIPEAVTDCFVICSADSKLQVKAIAEFIETSVKKKLGERTMHTEGYSNTEWVLLDYVDVVVHVFLRETREHFNLEEIWSDASSTEYN